MHLPTLLLLFTAVYDTLATGDISAISDISSITSGTLKCSKSKACPRGCCSKSGVCGTGPDFCSPDNCVSNCDYKSECDPGWGMKWSNESTCPLKVCCSSFGFCGTTAEFCGDKTVPSPSCSGRSSDKRTMGYFEGWNGERKCGQMKPSDIPLGYYTHINYAFAYIDPKTFRIAPMASDVAALYQNITQLKARQSDLQVWISIGGWDFSDSDKPTASTFSDLAGSESAQKEFAASLITFMENNNFDGVDIDWEYPVAEERNGKASDFKNFPKWLSNLRKALDESSTSFGLSITIPSSYWYMQHFDIVKIDPYIDWFNVMTYDLHGTWDAHDRFIGSNALAHTNLTEIEQTLDLLWRNNIDPARVNLGLGFYGRSFTMKDSSCMKAGCPFTGSGTPGRCTNTAGILSDVEIREIIASGAKVTLDSEAAVKIVTWNNTQWVSYDDAQTMKMRIDFVNKHCLGGTFAWAIDLDDKNGTTINQLGSDLSRKKSVILNATSGPGDSDLAWGLVTQN